MRGRGFESRHRIPDGHFFKLYCKKIVMLLNRPKINYKRCHEWLILRQKVNKNSAAIREEETSSKHGQGAK